MSNEVTTTLLNMNKYEQETMKVADELAKKAGKMAQNILQDTIDAAVSGAPSSVLEGKIKKAIKLYLYELNESIATLVADSVKDAYDVSYIEGRHDGERDVIKVFEALLNRGIIDEDQLDHAIVLAKNVSEKQYAKHTQDRPLTVWFDNDNNKEENV